MKSHTILFLVQHRSLDREVLAALSVHYEVLIAPTRREAIAFLENQSVALVLADVPSTRFNLARFWEEAQKYNPDMRFFLLLDKGTSPDQAPYAHDYLCQPFSPAQLLRRLARLLPAQPGEVVAWCGLRLDVAGGFLLWKTQQVPMTPKQAVLMRAFLCAPEQVLSRAQLMQDVWGTDFLGDTRTLDVHIHWLRKSLAQLQAPFVLATERGVGYRLLKARSGESANQ